MTKATLTVLSWLTLFVASIFGQDQACNYQQELSAGNEYYVYNSEYPYNYKGQQFCIWTLTSEYRVNLSCNSFSLPRSENCVEDSLSIQISQNTTHKYCGNGTFSIESEESTMTITLWAPVWTKGGRFVCEARLIERPKDSEDCRCGWKNPSRIVGGNETGVNEYPMMAGIVDAHIRSVYCGCTIISDTYLLTAAHCMVNRDINYLGILVGDHDLTTGTETNATKLIPVKRYIIHPKYDSKIFLNDIAVIEVKQKMIFSNEVGPACLPFQHSPDTFGGSYVDILGWGTTEYTGPTADVLQKVTVSVITNLECSKTYNQLTSDNLCTYSEGKDACQMDSGGPVLWQNPTTRRLVLVGIINYGRGCGYTSGVNCRVGGYVDWIVSVTRDAAYCIIE
ncbi:venom serine protease 34 [Ptiloglossa arizonensis]|uniref:venom serine protease 34 n=1 Tax=Ptiloglossa arizonensis TaxID=3350558 RepID=UPI003F9EDCF4